MKPSGTSRRFWQLVFVLLIAALAGSAWAFLRTRPHPLVTQSAYGSPHSASAAASTAGDTPAKAHYHHTSEYTAWKDLTREQQQILGPLASSWDHLSRYKRRSLLESAKLYPKMTKQQQGRFSSRLVQWTKLTKQERKTLRQKYTQLAALPREKQRELQQQWLEQHSNDANPAQ